MEFPVVDASGTDDVLHDATVTIELLTDQEMDAMKLSALLHNVLCEITGQGETRRADIEEFTAKIHDIQHLIMAQAAARAYPDHFRLLGGTVNTDSTNGQGAES